MLPTPRLSPCKISKRGKSKLGFAKSLEVILVIGTITGKIKPTTDPGTMIDISNLITVFEMTIGSSRLAIKHGLTKDANKRNIEVETRIDSDLTLEDGTTT